MKKGRPSSEVLELRRKVKELEDVVATVQSIVNEAYEEARVPFDTPGVVVGVWAMRKNLELAGTQNDRLSRRVRSAAAAFRVLSYIGPQTDAEGRRAAFAAASLGDSMAELLSKS